MIEFSPIYKQPGLIFTLSKKEGWLIKLLSDSYYDYTAICAKHNVPTVIMEISKSLNRYNTHDYPHLLKF
jgi:hypothetical protein